VDVHLRRALLAGAGEPVSVQALARSPLPDAAIETAWAMPASSRRTAITTASSTSAKSGSASSWTPTT
jgi:hypothetical protein